MRTPGSAGVLGAIVVAATVALGLAGCADGNTEPGVTAASVRRSSDASARVGPRENQDHWHAAFGASRCGVWEPDPVDVGVDAIGIHTHGDGLIHIHPFIPATSGRNATLTAFGAQIGLTFDAAAASASIVDGWSMSAIDGCGDAPARLVFEVWSPSALAAGSPPVVVSRPDDVVFVADGMAVAIALIAEDAPLTGPPPSVARLSDPLVAEGGGSSGTSTVHTSTAPSLDGAPVEPYVVPPTTPAGGPSGLFDDPVVVGSGDVGGIRVGRSYRAQLGDLPGVTLPLARGCVLREVTVGDAVIQVVTGPDDAVADRIISVASGAGGPDSDWWVTTRGIGPGSSVAALQRAYRGELRRDDSERAADPPFEVWFVDEDGERLVFLVDGDEAVGFITTRSRESEDPSCA